MTSKAPHPSAIENVNRLEFATGRALSLRIRESVDGREQLKGRDRSLVQVAVLAAHGWIPELELATRRGLAEGLEATELSETLLHVAAYGGIPSANLAAACIAQVLTDERIPLSVETEPLADKSQAEIDQDGTAVLSMLSGRPAMPPADLLKRLMSRYAGVGELAVRWAFGQVWSRTQLSRRDRSLVVISILGSWRLAEELAVHVPGGLRHGLNKTEIEEIMTELSLLCGIPTGIEGMRAARAAFAAVG